MSKKYESLAQLLQADSRARAFYDSLPEYVQQQIKTRGQSVNSFESLSDYADNLTRGEG